MPKSNWERITEPLQRQTSGNRFRWWIYLIISGSFFVLAWVLYFAHRQSLSSVIVSSVVLGIFVVGSLYLLRRKPVPLQLSALVAVMMGFCLFWMSADSGFSHGRADRIWLRWLGVSSLLLACWKWRQAKKSKSDG